MNNFRERTEEIARKFEKSPIIDGIINESEYSESKVKVLWILKEANSTGENDAWDLREAIANLNTGKEIKFGWEKTFRKIIYVTNGLINDMKWNEIPYTTDNPEIIDVLRKIAYINIKKVGGTSRANDKEIQEYYNASKRLLLDQIDSYNPDVIIFGNTYHYFKNDLNLNVFNQFGTCEATAKNGRIYISAYHPQYTIKEEKYFNDIIEAYKAFSKQIEKVNSQSTTSIQPDILELKKSLDDSSEKLKEISSQLFKIKSYEKAAEVKILEEEINGIRIKTNNI